MKMNNFVFLSWFCHQILLCQDLCQQSPTVLSDCTHHREDTQVLFLTMAVSHNMHACVSCVRVGLVVMGNDPNYYFMGVTLYSCLSSISPPPHSILSLPHAFTILSYLSSSPTCTSFPSCTSSSSPSCTSSMVFLNYVMILGFPVLQSFMD